jgi:UDP-MurNAc hydroxylase
MKVTLLSHASVLVEAGAIALYTDPWFMGQAFNESWSLINTPAATPADLHNASHIWISHEHPDHLHFPTLKAIPEEHKAKIILLYQEHFSSRICRALGSLGFHQVVELPLSQWYALDDEVSAFCSSVGTIDSLLAVRFRGVTVLNANDCPLSPVVAKAIARNIGPIDVLLTQFSISSWVGNPGEPDVAARRNMIARMRTYVNMFQPKVLIPFANFAYFSHSENRYLNKWINTPDYVDKQLSDLPCQLQFLYNGDSWSSQEGFSLRDDPLERYRMDFMTLADRPYMSHPSCSLHEVIDLGKKLVKNVRAAFPEILLRMAAPIHFYVVDLGITVRVDLHRSIVEAIQRTRSTCDMALSSQTLWYAFKFPWGFTTLEVSGRFELLNPNMNSRALYLFHLYASDISFKGLSRRLAQGRVWRFLWAKRHELLDRLIRGKHHGQPNPE